LRKWAKIGRFKKAFLLPLSEALYITMFTFGQSYSVSYLLTDEYQPFGTGQQEGFTIQPSVKVKSLIIGYQFSEFGYITFTVCDRLIQALYLDQLRTFAIQPVPFALLPLLIATPPAI
jgi:hypothetical protein